MPANKELGQFGEETAVEFLKRKGFKILERNFRIKDWGEIDIVARDGDTLVFVEVKALSSNHFQKPFEQVTPQKIARIKLAGSIYQDQRSHKLEPMRIDVVSVQVAADQKFEIEYFRGVEQ